MDSAIWNVQCRTWRHTKWHSKWHNILFCFKMFEHHVVCHVLMLHSFGLSFCMLRVALVHHSTVHVMHNNVTWHTTWNDTQHFVTILYCSIVTLLSSVWVLVNYWPPTDGVPIDRMCTPSVAGELVLILASIVCCASPSKCNIWHFIWHNLESVLGAFLHKW